MIAASQKVFDTYELIEAILAELPPLELVTMEHVYTMWRDLVVRSSILPTEKAVLPPR